MSNYKLEGTIFKEVLPASKENPINELRTPSVEVLAKLNVKYDSIKPTFTLADKYVVSSCLMSDSKDSYIGILNYSLNGDFKQVRF